MKHTSVINRDGRFKELLSASGLAFFVKAIAALGTFVLNVLIARLIGIEQSGYFNLALSIVTLISILSLQGFNNVLVRFISAYRASGKGDEYNQVYIFAVLRTMPASIAASFSLIYFSDWISITIFGKENLSDVISILSLSIAPLAICHINGYSFQGVKKVVHSMLALSAGVPIVLVPLIFIFEPTNAIETSSYYLLATLFVCITSSSIWYIYFRPKISLPEINVRQEVSAPLLSMFFIVLMTQITMWMGQIFLGVVGTATDVALFSSAQRTALLTSFILVSVNSIAAPKFAEAYRNADYEGIRDTARFSSRLMTAIAVPVLIFIFIFSDWIMSLFGEEFRESANILRVLAVGQFINVISGSVGFILQMTGKEKYFKYSLMVSCFLLLLIGPLASYFHGALGMAYVIAICMSTQNLLSVYFVKKKFGFNTMAFWR
ncbi:oligosaccharide flippase family protein [Ferrimonas balearica]|uniref:oligosaccharide flippase family protein n=1 Tax=Ferrimonas balearica TaxID=44012 RepID=UPI001C96B147|nr:oligosaccharide flippase family protein [Ferrimonas balearica]MBY6225137.1 oligosaccharide flippase family protein [Ferrimonas balearica]